MASTFAGRPLGLPDLQRRCDEVHVRLCRHLGLAPPRYHRQAAEPRLEVFCSSRRLRSVDRRRMTALLDLLHSPQDQEELGRQLAEALRQILVSVQGAARDTAALVFWTEFLRNLVRRGLSGVKLVICDAHEGIKAATARVLSTTWQRCRVHF